MSQTSRTSTNEHLEKIQGTSAWMREAIQLEPDPGNAAELAKSLRLIESHAAAMAETIESHHRYMSELEGTVMGLTLRVERLQRALVREVNLNRKLHGYAALNHEQVERWCHLRPGDLPNDDGSNGR